MIILATAIILSLNSSNIVEKAKEAKTASDMANIKQAATLAYAEYVLDLNEGKVASGTTAEEYVKAKLVSQGIAEDSLKTLMVTESGKVYLFKIPEGFVASSVSTEDEISEGLVIYEGTEPVTDANKETAQTTRNQYVWIPVEGEFGRVFLKNHDIIKNYTEPYSYDTTITEVNDLTGEYAEYAKMKASVTKYGGFYIARYEAGTSVERIYETNGTSEDVLFQKDKYPYTFVGWGPSMTSISGDIIDDGYNQGKGAVELARNIYTESANKGVVSTLMYGVQWDATMNFMKDVDNPNVEGKKYIMDSTGMGSYNTLRKKTGSNDSYMVKNVYDIAGNMAEWTMEAYGANNRVVRGGAGCDDGASYPASMRSYDRPTYASDNVRGFRPALYIK